MGFFDKLTDFGGDYFGSDNMYGLGGVFGYMSNKSDEKDAQNAASENSRLSANAQTMQNASKRSQDKRNQFYGASLDNLGQESTDYANMLKGNLNKNVAKADQYNQQAGQQRGLDNARAGLSGVDTSAMNEQGRRNASFGAAAINEDAQRQALDLYGQSISNRITGANTIDTQEQALGIASLQQPVAQAGQGGILSSIFGGLF